MAGVRVVERAAGHPVGVVDHRELEVEEAEALARVAHGRDDDIQLGALTVDLAGTMDVCFELQGDLSVTVRVHQRTDDVAGRCCTGGQNVLGGIQRVNKSGHMPRPSMYH